MFESLKQIQSRRSIIVQTRAGNNVENEIVATPTAEAHVQYEQYRARFGANWIQRKPPCGGYNCFGMLFASRRTGVFEDDKVERILTEDGYRCVDNPRDYRMGDIVIYRLRQSGVLAHGGGIASVIWTRGLAPKI